MFLSMADFGEKKTIARITGKEDTRHHLESLGFVEGADVTVVSSLGGNLLVNVQVTRVALSRRLATTIIA